MKTATLVLLVLASCVAGALCEEPSTPAAPVGYRKPLPAGGAGWAALVALLLCGGGTQLAMATTILQHSCYTGLTASSTSMDCNDKGLTGTCRSAVLYFGLCWVVGMV